MKAIKTINLNKKNLLYFHFQIYRSQHTYSAQRH